jgi:metal-dependent amidase/aminoacylase/carboxypeptidase family protein
VNQSDPSSTSKPKCATPSDAEVTPLIALRRELHLHPELSGEETRTARLVAEHLRALDLEVHTEVGGHGVVGVLYGSRPGPTVGYRADMDAIPLQETLDRPYHSLHLGISHACGHDAHVAIALGAAERLVEQREALSGTIKFIFQPAEESLDGAQAMIKDGVLAAPRPQVLLAQHAFPLPSGTLGLTSGLCLAGMEEFRVRFYAPAGNLAAIRDQAMTALEGLSTSTAPTTPEAFDAVLDAMLRGPEHRQTVFLSCWPHSEGHVPPYHILGLVSIPDFSLREDVHHQIRHVLDEVSAAFGATYDWEITFTNPPLVNDPSLAQYLQPRLTALVGEDNLLRFQAPYPFAHEDLSRFASEVPTLLVWLGTANRERAIPSILHTPDFDIEEDALALGVDVASTALRCLLNAPDTIVGADDQESDDGSDHE